MAHVQIAIFRSIAILLDDDVGALGEPLVAAELGASGRVGCALDRDHDGSVLDDVGGFLGGGGAASANGAGILKHVLGGKQSTMESALGQVSGLDAGSAGQVLQMLAPLVMGALGKAKQQNNLDADGLASMLGAESSALQKRSPGGADMLMKLLDQDGDGGVMDDLAKMGSGLLGGLLRK